MRAWRGTAGLTTVEFLILTLILGVFMSAAMNEFMSSLGAGLLTAALFLILAVIGEKRKWPGFPSVVVIMGVLAGGAVSAHLITKVADDPNSHFARLRRKAEEGATKGDLAAIRQAVKAHQDGHEGRSPSSLVAVVVRPARLKPHHPDSAAVRLAAAPDDAGGWLYDATAGKAFVNCTHTDTHGSVWTGY